MTHVIQHIGVVGAGAWGTALAILARRAGAEVTLWSRNQSVVDAVERARTNAVYLPDIYIDPSIAVTTELSRVCTADALLLVVPSQSMRSIAIAMSDLVGAHIPLIICTKGIERGSLALMSEVVSSILPENPVAVLSGPNFADEAASGKPTATALACADAIMGDKLAYAVGGRMFRVYGNQDLMGTQIGGAVKNVIAIACGIATGRGMGENARAALITRGMAELQRLCLAKGGRIDTLMGLSGIGDLLLTCTSQKSRNMALGVAIGEHGTVDDALRHKKRGITEGVFTAESVTELAHKLGVQMPICTAVHKILHQHAAVEETVRELLARPFTHEETVLISQ